MATTEPISSDATAATPHGLSIVIPAYEAADQIAATLAGLRAELAPLATNFELIVVDDGSRDGTAQVALAARRTHGDVRLVRNRRNLGKGLSVYAGVLASRYSHVCFTDADLAFSRGDYVEVARRALSERKLVVASRRLPNSQIQVRMEVLAYASRRHLIGVAFNRLVRAALSLPYGDTQCGLKAFPRDAGLELFRRLRSSGFLFDIEIFVAARDIGLSIDEVPVHIYYNDFKSTVRLAHDSARFLGGLLQIAWRARSGAYHAENPAMAPERIRAQFDELHP